MAVFDPLNRVRVITSSAAAATATEGAAPPTAQSTSSPSPSPSPSPSSALPLGCNAAANAPAAAPFSSPLAIGVLCGTALACLLLGIALGRHIFGADAARRDTSSKTPLASSSTRAATDDSSHDAPTINPLRPAADRQLVARAAALAALHYENGSGDLPPEWGWQEDADGRVIYIRPDGTYADADPRHSFDAYEAEFISAAERGVDVAAFFPAR